MRRQTYFWGMQIKYMRNRTAEIRMKDYLTEAICDFHKGIHKSAASPATRDLFEVDLYGAALDEEKAENFRSIVAKLLYVSQRADIDMQLTIAFLCTHVSCSIEEDWAKLKRLLEYINSSIDKYRVLEANNITRILTWVDASCAVHRDMKSYTGGAVLFSTSAVLCKSSKQKIETKSLTEAKLVGASNYLPHAIWAKKFLSSQGYKLVKNAFYQDNQSAICFERNGRKSSGPNSRHINIRHFFIKGRLEIKDSEVRFCPTEQMLADFFIKPLQEALFSFAEKVITTGTREHGTEGIINSLMGTFTRRILMRQIGSSWFNPITSIFKQFDNFRGMDKFPTKIKADIAIWNILRNSMWDKPLIDKVLLRNVFLWRVPLW